MTRISLPQSRPNSFSTDDLKSYIRKSGRDFIIQGQQQCTLADHTKELSLDYWLRQNYAGNSDTRQALNSVIADLVNTGEFDVGRFSCPETGFTCKGIRIVR
jgi:hypothetical protein